MRGCAQQSFRRKCLSAPKCPCDGITFKAEICNLEPCRSPQTRCCDNMTPVLTATGDYICGKSDGNSNLIVQPQVVQAVQPNPKSVAVEEPQLQLEEACCADPRGTWSSWRAADQCNKECGGFGRQNRKRLCLSTPHGCPCIGNTDEVVACNLRPCPFSAKTPSSCAPGLTIQFRSNNPLCISPEFQATQQSSFNTNRGQPNQQQRNQVQSNPQRFQPSNARQSFGGPNVQFDGGPVQVREELSEDEENDQVDTGDVIQKNKSASQEVIELNKTDKREDISFADNNLFEAPLDKLAERIENGEQKPNPDSSSPEHIDLSSTDPPNLPDASSTSKPVERDPLTRSKRQVQQPSTLQTPATTQNQLDYQRFLQQQASGTNSLLTNQPATLGSTISYSDLFGYSSNAANSNPQPNTQQLLAGNTYLLLLLLLTPTAATEDRTGQAALVGIHPGQLEWQEDQARAAAGRVAVAIPAVAAAASSSGLQRAGVDPGTTSSTSATQSSSFFLGINNQGRSFNQRNGRVLTIIPGYLVVQSSSADVAARLLSQLKPNRLGLGSKSSRLSVIYPALRPQGTANQPSAATAATNVAASAVAQALANQVALLNAASTNSNAGPAALELTRPGTSQSSSQGNQVLVGTGQVVNNQDNGFGGINPISVGGFAGFDTGDSGNIQQGQEEAPVYFEGQARNLDEEEPVVEYAPAVQAYRKIKEQDLDDNNSQKDETNRAILAEDGIEFGEELVSKDEFDSKIGISNQFEEMNADMEVMKKCLEQNSL
uniref:Uncharacterized protein n=1 Tax=Ditylenchus dipsaci TaxID=166011 RepID=A0A915DRV5_9BILA